MQKRLVTALALVAVLGAGTAIYSDICRFTDGSAFLDPGPSYCHNIAQVNHHIVTDCPCRVQGSVSASGPFACSFTSVTRWGGMFGMNEDTDSAPTALVSTYDITLDCNESYKVEMYCTCDGRPSHTYWVDQGSCDTVCE